MKLQGRILTFCFSLILVSSLAFAQEDVLRPHGGDRTTGDEATNYLYRRSPFALGLEGGIDYSFYSATMTWTPTRTDSPLRVFEKANGISGFFGAFADFSLSSSIGIQLHLSYNGIYYSNSFTGKSLGFNTVTGGVDPIDEKTDVNVRGAYIGITPMLRFNFSPEFFAAVGPFVLVPSGDFKQKNTSTILTPGYYKDLTTQSTTATSENTVTDVKTLTGIAVNLGYKINISPSVFIVPQAGIKYSLTVAGPDEIGFTDPTSLPATTVDATKKMTHIVQLGVALWFNL
jgi:hypothetical protein